MVIFFKNTYERYTERRIAQGDSLVVSEIAAEGIGPGLARGCGLAWRSSYGSSWRVNLETNVEKGMPVGENPTDYFAHRRSVLRTHVRQAGPGRKPAMNSFATDLDHPASDHPVQRRSQ